MIAVLWVACTTQPPTPPPAPPAPLPTTADPSLATPPPNWPHADAALYSVPLEVPEGFGKRRVVIDAGHGAGARNKGNKDAFCRQEQDMVADVATGLTAALEQTGHFEVLLTRKRDEVSTYASRLTAASAFRAEALVSIHSDIRIPGKTWEPDWVPDANEPKVRCKRRDEAAGYTVLWGDDGVDGGLPLARAVARRMGEAGFPAYRGEDYKGMYVEDTEVHGVMLDRHVMKKRLYMLRSATMPSIIIETHHALYVDEVRRWDEAETRSVFYSAVAQALVDTLSSRSPQPPEGSEG